MAIEQIFFDVGDVLFSEDAPHILYMHSLLLALRRSGVDAEWDEYLDRVRQLVRTHPSSAPADAARSYVTDESKWTDIFNRAHAEYQEIRKPHPYGVLRDGMKALIAELAKDFRLGVLANQHPPVVQALADYGLTPYFNVVGIDEVVGLSKPDPAFFAWGLEQAGCAAASALMVGDRADHDIGPAKRLGMKTIRLRVGMLYVYYDPLDDSERADLTAYDMPGLLAAIRTLAAAA